MSPVLSQHLSLCAISERQIGFSPYSRSPRLVAMTTLGGWVGSCVIIALNDNELYLSDVRDSPWSRACGLYVSVEDLKMLATWLVKDRWILLKAFALGGSLLFIRPCAALTPWLDADEKVLETLMPIWRTNFDRTGRQPTIIPIVSSAQPQRPMSSSL